MTRTPGIAIGLDLGTSSLKAIAVDVESGAVLSRVRRPYATRRPEPGAAEQSPSDWMAAVVAALGELAAATPATSWVGIGLSAMLPTLVRTDHAGEPVGPAIVWEDHRAEEEAQRLHVDQAAAVAYERTGQLLDGRYLVPMHLRLAERAGADAPEVARILGAKDYLFGQLTGEVLTDPSTAAGSGVFDLTTGTYATGPWPELPAVAPATTVRGLDAGLARIVGAPAGLPVALGAADSVLGAEALGARPGRDIAVIAGTSTVVLGVRDRLAFDADRRALVTPLAQGGYGLEMDLVATGSAFQWLATLTGAGDPAILIAESAEIDPLTAPQTLPFLGPGEQGALWDPELRGGFSGLTLATTRGALMRGLANGVVLELARCVRVLAEAGDGRILVAGSSLAAPVLLQDLADACEIEVHADPSDADHSALGAVDVLLAALGTPAVRPGPDFERFLPRPSARATWAALAAQHEEAIARERERILVAHRQEAHPDAASPAPEGMPAAEASFGGRS